MLVTLSFAVFGVLLAREYRRPTLSAGAVLVASAVFAAIAVARPPHGSHDLWSYAMYGRIFAVHHHNPYVQLPAAFPSDPILSHVSRGWRHTGSYYGPGFTVLCAAIVSVTRDSALATRLAFQTMSAAALLGCGVVLSRIGVRRWVLIAVVLNPLVLITIVNGGHIDPLLALLLLLATLAIDRERFALGAVALAAALGIKAVMVLPVGAAVLWVWRRHGRRAGARVAVVATAPAIAGGVAFGGRKILRPLLGGARQLTRASMWSLLTHVPGVSHHLGLAAVVVTGFVTLALVATRIDSPSVADAIAAGVIGYLIAAAYVLPWYLMWALPLAAIGTTSRTLRLVLVYTAAIALAFAYHPTAHPDLVDRLLHACVTATEVALLVTSAWVICAGAARLRAIVGSPIKGARA